ncbi:MAG: hypothetical protein HY079_00450 [Elusimicrobia bacterium]|nr:hypothetical protein [Elusimicrobiota bacterium]
MRKLITAAGLLVACTVGAYAYTPTAGTKIAGSKHDFTLQYNGQDMKAVTMCSTCHEMHKPAKMAPLWARQDPTATGWIVQSHDVAHALTDPGETGFIAASDFVKARSGMCLSCHDGTMAISNGVVMDAASRANFGRDLSENHNVGRERSATSNGVAVAQSILDTHDTAVVNGVTKYYIGCGSCHAMHNNNFTTKLVRNVDASVAASGPVCLNCHSTK